MKKEIMAYITSTINQYSRVDDCSITSVVDDLMDMNEFVADIKEYESTVAEDNAIYIKRNVELQAENAQLEEEIVDLKITNISWSDLYEENIILKDEIADLKEIRSVTLSAGKELQELRSKLAEVEKAAEYSCKLYHDASMKLAETNNKLNYENEVLKCRNEKLEKELIFGAK